ncbi:MAG: hypothetical protein WDK95_10500 [Syntrophorhabdaceae bacterium]|jgi:hypothetical protein
MKCPKCKSIVRAEITENSPDISFEVRETRYTNVSPLKYSIDFTSACLDGANGSFELFCTNPTGICPFSYGFGEIDRYGNVKLWDAERLRKIKGDNL